MQYCAVIFTKKTTVEILSLYDILLKIHCLPVIAIYPCSCIDKGVCKRDEGSTVADNKTNKLVVFLLPSVPILSFSFCT